MKRQKLFKFLFIISLISLNSLLSCSSREEYERGCDCEVDGLAIKTLTVGPNILEAKYSTYDSSGKINADGACHAKMSLTFRWKDPDKATNSNERPPLYYEFQTLFGYFPTNPGMETTTIDNGYHVWKIKISEAADKSKPGENTYGIYLKYIGEKVANNEILCDIKIDYNIYNESAYSVGCYR